MGKTIFRDIIEKTIEKVGTPLSAKEIWEKANENADFNDFLKLITEDCKLGKIKSQYDKVLKPDELIDYIEKKGINK